MEVAKRELTDRKDLDRCKHVFCSELKRKTALVAILKTLKVGNAWLKQLLLKLCIVFL